MFSFAPMKFWKQLIATFLLFGILTNCFNYWVLSSSYIINKKYISTVLCTNKDNHELHCEGKCFMDIKLKELDQKNKSDQENLKRIIETVEPITASLLAPLFKLDIPISITLYLVKKPVNNVGSIFQPPKYA